MTGDEEYQYVEIESEAARSGPSQYIADTNVISHVESMLRGSQPAKPTPQRDKAADLARRLSRNLDITLIDDFALIEGSSFQDTSGLKSTSIFLRDAAYALLNSRPNDLYSAAAEIVAFGQPDGYDQAVLKQLDESIELMMHSVVPAYYAALTLEHHLGKGQHPRLEESSVQAVLKGLSATFNYVPGTLWLTVVLACCGDHPSRAAALGVFKTGQLSKKTKTYVPAQNALSAAWDLGSMQTLSNKLSRGVRSILVTEDKALAALVTRIWLLPGALHIPDAHLDQSTSAADRLRRLYDMYPAERAGKTPTTPVRELAAAAIEDLETKLGTSTAMPSVLRNGFQLRSPRINFSESDLDAAVLVVAGIGDDDARIAAIGELCSGKNETLQYRINALICLTVSAARFVVERDGGTVRSVIAPHLQTFEKAADYLQVFIDFDELAGRPLTAITRYELLTREDRIRKSMTIMSAVSYRLCMELASTHGIELSSLVAAAAADVLINQAPAL